MQIGIFTDETALATTAAKHLIKILNNSENKVLGLATGSTPLPLYEQLRAANRAGKFTLRGVQGFALDEYVGIAADHPERYRNVLRAELVGDDKTGLREEDLHTPEGNAADPRQAAADYDAAIKAAGGIAIQILGIGADGHIGFNEPGTSLTSRTHVDVLTEQTRRDNARFFENDMDKVPSQCITQGLGTIMEAKYIMLIATGENKATAVRELVEGGISARWQASMLQMHPNALILVDEAAASELQLAVFYRERWNHNL